MTSLPTTSISPQAGPTRLAAPASSLSGRVIVEFAAAEDVGSGMERVVPLLRRPGGVNRVEWWVAEENAAQPRPETADGPRRRSQGERSDRRRRHELA
jgi:hypothetical protein